MTWLRLQQLSISMEEGTVLQWLVADGTSVVPGQPVVEIETDKATMEVEAPEPGVLRIVAASGTTVPIDGVLAEIVAADASRDDRSGPRTEPSASAASEPAGVQAATGPSASMVSTVAHRAADRALDSAGLREVHRLPTPVMDAIPGPRPTDLSVDQLISLYSDMVRVRAFEEEVISAFNDGLIPGSTHPCIGAEAIKAGALATLRPDDLIFATYRGHGEALIKGANPVSVMAELMGRETGICKGKGGSMHLSEPSIGLMSTNAIVAGHIPMAGGAALSCQFRRTSQVVMVFFGDGASCEGEFFESLNMAMIWQVPLIFICENNGVAISVPTTKSQATPDIADRAKGFGMPSTIVDGNDVLSVRAAVGECVDRARKGGGPSFVECKTVRWERHSAFSAGGHDPLEQRRAWQRVDPILRFRKSLLAWSASGETELELIGDEMRVEMQAVRNQAERAPFPRPESVYEDIYAHSS